MILIVRGSNNYSKYWVCGVWRWGCFFCCVLCHLKNSKFKKQDRGRVMSPLMIAPDSGLSLTDETILDQPFRSYSKPKPKPKPKQVKLTTNP